MVADINPGSLNSNPMYLTNLWNKSLIFTATHALYGSELWVYDTNLKDYSFKWENRGETSCIWNSIKFILL